MSAKKKILLVDDGRTLRIAAKTFLEKAEYEVVMAEDGFKAINKVIAENPDLILMDVMMDKLNGYQTCTLIKSNAKYSHIPIIMVSGKDGPFDKIIGEKSGCQDYITKPFTESGLVNKVKEYL